MKICVVQTKPVKGDIQGNIENHQKLIELAVSYGAEIIIFPELSLTGYEPHLAQSLATTEDDASFAVFQEISDTKKIVIGVGVPTKSNGGIRISMALFQPDIAIQFYSKKFLHADEEPFFVGGENIPVLKVKNNTIGLAICYEISVPEHSEHAYKSGAEIYIASVAKSLTGVEQASTILSSIARNYSMTVLMSNCVGPSDDFDSAGKSSIWDENGTIVGQLNTTSEGIIMINTATKEIVQETLECRNWSS